MPERRPTVILADDHPMVLESLRHLLAPTLDVVAAVADGAALLAAAERLRPDLVVADISMPGVDGIEATRRLKTIAPAARVLILSYHGEDSWVRAAFDAGAWGYLTKASAPDEIEGAIREVLAGRCYVSPSVARALLPNRAASLKAPTTGAEALTSREREVAGLVGRGLANKQIADRLGVSVSTVRTHLRSVYDKLELRSRVELAIHAARIVGGAG